MPDMGGTGGLRWTLRAEGGCEGFEFRRRSSAARVVRGVCGRVVPADRLFATGEGGSSGRNGVGGSLSLSLTIMAHVPRAEDQSGTSIELYCNPS